MIKFTPQDVHEAVFQAVNTISPGLTVTEFHKLMEQGEDPEEVSRHDAKAVLLGITWLYSVLMDRWREALASDILGKVERYGADGLADKIKGIDLTTRPDLAEDSRAELLAVLEGIEQ